VSEQPSPVFDIRTCTFGEALSIYLYAHRQIDDVRDVGQAYIVRGNRSLADHTPAAWIFYRTRGANSRDRQWEIAPEPVEFSFDLQQTLARYASGIVDAEVAAAKAEIEAMREAHRLADEASLARATEGTDPTWSADPGQDD
jgi:hypothetical protein